MHVTGNEVLVTAGVRFITHDMIRNTIGKIVVENGVMLGGDSVII